MASRAEEPEISILAVLIVLARRKLLIAGSTCILTLAGAIGVNLVPNSFTAEAVILPPQQQQSSLAVLASGALGNLAGSGMASQLGLKNPADLYIGILKSRTISDEIITRFHLQDLYHQKCLSDARSILGRHTSFASGKESLITISVQDRDPIRAAAMANAFVDELYKENSQLAVTDASQRRLFFEQLLHKEKDALSDAEIALKDTQQLTGLVVSARNLPAVSLAYVRKFRDVKYHETLYEVLAKQYEAAVIDEAKQAPVIQVVDRAKTPDRKSGPARTLITLSAGFIGFVLSVVYVAMVHSITLLCADPVHGNTMADIRAAMRFRRNTSLAPINEPASALLARAAAQSGCNNKFD